MKRTQNNSFLEELEKLPSEHLHNMLRAELDRSHKDEALILQISSVLEQRFADEPQEEDDPAVMAAWLRFQAAYDSAEGREQTRREKVHNRNRWLVKAVAAAAVLCLIITALPKAEGAKNFWEAIGQCTQELFSFFSSGQPDETYTFTTDNPDLQAIYDAVVQEGVTRPVVPTWIPEGYELQELREFPSPVGNKIYARLINGEDSIVISYEFHGETVTNKYAKDDVNVEMYEAGGIKHYLMPNGDVWTAAWTVGDLECSIMTNLEKDELCQIIRSIY